MLALAVIATFLVMRSGQAYEGDVYWQARAGLSLMDGAPIIGPDSFSWSAAGESWTPNSWGWNLLLGVSWTLAGYSGLAFLGLTASLALFGLLIQRSRSLNASASATGIAMVLTLSISWDFLSPRPQLASYVALVLVLGLYETLIRTDTTKKRWALIGIAFAVQVVATNLHLAAASAVAVMLVAAVFCIAFDGRQHATISAAYVAALIVATLVTPIGLGIISQSIDVNDAARGLNLEWTPGVTQPAGVFAMVLGLFVGLWDLLRKKRAARAGALFFLVALTATTYRFTPLLVIVAAPELAAGLTDIHRFLKTRARYVRVVPGIAALLWTVGAVVPLFNMAIASQAFGRAPENEVLSARTAYAIPTNCKLLNDKQEGGLITLLRPDIKVSVDGRIDLFGKALVETQAGILDGNANALKWLDDNAINCVVVDYSSSFEANLADQLGQDTEWQNVFYGFDNAVFKRI